MDDRDRDVKKKLDEVIGTGFDTVSTDGLRRKVRNNVLKWSLGVTFAIVAVLTIVTIIETHRLPPDVPPRPGSKPAPKAVPIQIVPEPAGAATSRLYPPAT